MKTKIFVAVLVSLLVISIVSAATPSPAERQLAIVTPSGTEIAMPQQAIESSPAIEPSGAKPTRVIVPTTSAIDKRNFRLKGCTILHELNDATALECPKGVVIEGARPDRLFHVHDLEADVQIGADLVWQEGYEGTGVLVAILDTGVDDVHIELSDSIVATKNFIRGPGFDKDGHGTHVSGVITGDGVYEIEGNYATGVSPAAAIIVGKVCGDIGCYESDIMAGIEWAVAQDADVLNLSLGGGNFCDHCDDDPLAAKVNWAVSEGVVVVVSAGNDGAGVSSPACASGAIAVGAVDKSDVRPDWSNYGNALDLVAPGVDILSTYSCRAAGDCRYYWYAWMSGTSMSAPHVAGTAALILQKNLSYTVEDVKNALYNTAFDLGNEGYDPIYGWGIVDAYAAVAAVPPATGSISGTVTNAEDGTAISGATVTLDTGESAITAANGNYTITDVRTGDRSVTASADGFKSQTKTATITENQTTTVDFALNPVTTATTVSVDSITYDTEGGRYQDKHLLIKVTLIDDVGSPVAGALVSIELYRDGSFIHSQTRTTEADGTAKFSLKNAPSGCYTETGTVSAAGLTWDNVWPDSLPTDPFCK